MNEKIAIQGIKGSFHHQVAQEYFQENIVIDERLSFEAVVQSLLKQEANFGVMAIENSIAGAIIPNYALIDKNNLNIIGEYYLDIVQNLITLEGQSIEEIQEVHSHPMALLQCMDFLKKYPHLKLVEDSDTATTALRIHENKLTNIAAIGSKVAAEMYDLKISVPSIQAVNNNMTRFFILSKENFKTDESEINKASIKFELEDTPGSLATVLNVMTNCKLNLTKIQSMPIIHSPFQYSFFVDVVFKNYEHYAKAKEILQIMTSHFKVLGEYRNSFI
ncbi:MAG: prephenate dehydratase [Flavobacterium sp.]